MSSENVIPAKLHFINITKKIIWKLQCDQTHLLIKLCPKFFLPAKCLKANVWLQPVSVWKHNHEWAGGDTIISCTQCVIGAGHEAVSILVSSSFYTYFAETVNASVHTAAWISGTISNLEPVKLISHMSFGSTSQIQTTAKYFRIKP